MENEYSEKDRLAKLLRGWGAEPGEAETMAGQLLKRARQMAEKKGVSEIEALEYLLKVTAAGRAGTVYEGPKPGEKNPGR